MNYKPGDLIKCIKDRGWIWLIQNKIYKVQIVSPSDYDYIFIVGGVIPYPKNCFIPHPATQLEKMICGYYEP